MLLLDDGTHFTHHTSAATKFAKASDIAWRSWLNKKYLQAQPPTQVFLDSVVQRMMLRKSVRQQPVQQQPVRQQRSLLAALGMQLSALPPPVVDRTISPPGNI